MKFDLHVHTVFGSSDSNLTVEQVISESNRIGLDGLCLTEHGGGWTSDKISESFKDSGLVVIPALEVNTEFGHVIAIGITSHLPGIHKIDVLRKVIDQHDGVLISAHPMRNFFNKPPYDSNLIFRDFDRRPDSILEIASHELFDYVDFIEVTNGANTSEENNLAFEISQSLNKNGTGGSDAHSIQGIGKSVTVFDSKINDTTSLVKNLKLGNFYPAEGLNIGRLTPFTK